MPPVSKRKRVRKACIPCHERKRKCDAQHPCNMCVTYDYSCKYLENIIASGEAISPVESPTTPSRKRPRHGTSRTTSLATRPGNSPAEASVVASGSSTSPPTGIFDEKKFRYAGASSAMAFPHVLGAAFGAHNPAGTHSFAYNFGIRPEEAANPHGSIGAFISEADLRRYSSVFFESIAPLFDVIDRDTYTLQCNDCYHGSGGTAAFAAVAAGVAALGSFLSQDKYPQESELVRYAKSILDDPASTRLLGVDQIVAWGMRVIYLRATTRPSNAWIASCISMHLCEAAGLHEEENIKKMASFAATGDATKNAERLRRIFWISWAGHSILSYEYDRTPVILNRISCQAITAASGTVSDQFVHLAQIVPSPNSRFQLESTTSTPTEELFERLLALKEMPCNHPFLVVTKAELAFCFYRRIYQLKMGIPEQIGHLIVDHGNAAVEAAGQLASKGQFFWNVIGSVFQYVCVLLAMDSPTASAHIASAFQALENLVKTVDTVLTRKALSMARHLLHLSVERKRKDLARWEAVGANQSLEPPQARSEDGAMPDMSWAEDWDQFLVEPFLSLLGSDVQL